MSREQVSAGTTDHGQPRGGQREWVASTSCLVVVFAVLFLLLVVAPALLWSAGIACG